MAAILGLDDIAVPMQWVLCCRSFTLQVHNLKKPRTVRQLHIYHCAHPLAELSELKTRPDLWRKV